MKKKLIGYRLLDEKGSEVKTLVGTQPRRDLNKFRKTFAVRKVYANRRGESFA